MLRLRHASAANDNYIDYLQFIGKDSARADEIFAYMTNCALSVAPGAENASYEFWTIRNGTRAQRMAVGTELVVGPASGGDLGAGTINATAVYDDNVLFTCGPAELRRTRRIDLDKWDALAPARH